MTAGMLNIFTKIFFGLLVVLGIVVFAVILLYTLFPPLELKKPNTPLELLVFSSSRGAKNAVVYIAKMNGYFADEGLAVDIKDVPLASVAFEEMLDKKKLIDIVAAADSILSTASFLRNDFTILATISEGYDDKIIARRDRGIQTVADLTGKKIGVSKIGTSAHYFLSTLLAFNDIKDSDIEIVVVGTDKLFSSLQDGTVDALALWEPDAYKAKQMLGDNAVSFPNTRIYRKTFNLIAAKQFVQTRPDIVKKFLRAAKRARDFIVSHPEKAKQMIADFLRIDKFEVEAIWNENTVTLSLDQSLIITLENQARWAVANALVKEDQIPNYLEDIFFEGLTAIDPAAVTIPH